MDPSSFDKLKCHVRHQLTKELEPLLRLRAADTIQRLGVVYHFEYEINEVLNSMSMDIPEVVNCVNDVYSRTLLFRLRRQNRSAASGN
jgi:hypothetical protein